jgi:hypothetical protein
MLAESPFVPDKARRRACRPGLVTASTVVAPWSPRRVRSCPRIRAGEHVAGAAGRADLRDAGPDGPPPGSCRCAGDLLVAGACGAYRLAARTAFGLRVLGERGLGLRRHQHLESLAREAVVLAACAATEVVPPAAGVAVGGRSVPLRPAQRRGTRSAPGVSHREYLLPGHQTGAIRGTQDQLTRMNLPLPPAVVGGRRASTAKARRVIVARQSPFSARQITRCRRIARNSALGTEDELK